MSELLEQVARAINPRVWQAFDGYLETGFCPKDYTRNQQWDAFIYGSPLDRGHDWGRDLQASIEAAEAALGASGRDALVEALQRVKYRLDGYADIDGAIDVIDAALRKGTSNV